jgi:hypothetical protein
MTLPALLAWLAVGAVAGIMVGRLARDRSDRKQTALGRARSAMLRSVRWVAGAIGGRGGGSNSDSDDD